MVFSSVPGHKLLEDFSTTTTNTLSSSTLHAFFTILLSYETTMTKNPLYVHIHLHRHLHSTNNYSIFNLLVLARRFCRRLQLTTLVQDFEFEDCKKQLLQDVKFELIVVTRERRVIWRSIATQNFCKTRIWGSIATMGSHNWKSRNTFPLLHIFKLPGKKQIWKLSSTRGLGKCGSQEEANLVKLWSNFCLCLHVAITPGTQETQKNKKQLHSTTYKNK